MPPLCSVQRARELWLCNKGPVFTAAALVEAARVGGGGEGALRIGRKPDKSMYSSETRRSIPSQLLKSSAADREHACIPTAVLVGMRLA
jgi:hypothetical protein